MRTLFIILTTLFLPVAILTGQVSNPSVSAPETLTNREQITDKLPSESGDAFNGSKGPSLRVGPGDGMDEALPTEENTPIKEGTVTVFLLVALYAVATALVNRKKLRPN